MKEPAGVSRNLVACSRRQSAGPQQWTRSRSRLPWRRRGRSLADRPASERRVPRFAVKIGSRHP